MSGRYGPTATPLPSGNVLIAGATEDMAPGGIALCSPAAGNFTYGGFMMQARNHHKATILPNGTVLATRGYITTDGYLSSAELYDPNIGRDLGKWYSIGSMSTARRDHTITRPHNGRILVLEGKNGTGDLLSAEYAESDGAAWFWYNAGTMITVRAGHSAILLPNGKVLIAGGETNQAEIYDPESKTFSATGSMCVPRTNFTATLLPEGKALISGGSDACDNLLSSSEIYQPGH